MSDSLIAFQPAIELSVEHEAVGQHVLVDHPRGHGQVLPLALGVGEAEVDPVDLLVLDARKDRVRRRSPWVCSPLSKSSIARTNCTRPATPGSECDSSLWTTDSGERRESQEGSEYFTRTRRRRKA